MSLSSSFGQFQGTPHREVHLMPETDRLERKNNNDVAGEMRGMGYPLSLSL